MQGKNAYNGPAMSLTLPRTSLWWELYGIKLPFLVKAYISVEFLKITTKLS